MVEPLPVTAEAARSGPNCGSGSPNRGRRAKINDLWIAAVTYTNGMDVITQDEDFDVIQEAGGPSVIRV